MLGVGYYGQIPGGAMRLIVAIFACVLMGGCQTMAQRQLTSIQKGSQVAEHNMLACARKIETNPAYRPMFQRIPFDARVNPTLTQLADNGVTNDEDIEAIIAIHNELAPCRERAIEDLMKIIPGIVPIFIQSFHAMDLIFVDLIQRKITWGEANKRRVALRDDSMAKLQAAGVQLDRELAASHQAELAQRQAALDALSQWAHQQQVLRQNQQLINSLNRPVITNCSNYGNSVRCSSY